MTRLFVLFYLPTPTWLLLCLCFPYCSSFSVPIIDSGNSSPATVVVVGKIVIDEYGAPDVEKRKISIGGGGPQAAFGAAAALAMLSYNEDDNDGEISCCPPRQPVIFVGPVGGLDWNDQDDAELDDMLGNAIESIQVVRGESLSTPRIQLWHDSQQIIQWHPLNDSFGLKGAMSLWQNRPSSSDILGFLDPSNDQSFVCHVIMEGGDGSNGMDIEFLRDHSLRKRVTHLGIEPVTFADETTGKVPDEMATAAMARMISLQPSFVCPDEPLFLSTDGWDHFDVATRQGPEGSTVRCEGKETKIPVATLKTVDGKVVNPTGAGNAYSAAYTTCRSRGLSIEEAASCASAVGAVFCEYDHIPPWTSAVISRIKEARDEILKQVDFTSGG